MIMRCIRDANGTAFQLPDFRLINSLKPVFQPSSSTISHRIFLPRMTGVNSLHLAS